MSDAFATQLPVAHQAPLSMGVSKQEHCSGQPFPTAGDLPDPGVKPMSLTLQVDSLLSELLGKSWTTRDISPCQPLDEQSPFPEGLALANH